MQFLYNFEKNALCGNYWAIQINLSVTNTHEKRALFLFFSLLQMSIIFTEMYHICVNFFYGSFSNLNFYFSVFFLELYSDKFISSRGFFKNKLSILALFLNKNNKIKQSTCKSLIVIFYLWFFITLPTFFL